MDNRADKSTGRLVLTLSGLVALMFGFGYLLVPLYDILCEITGLNGKTSAEAANIVEVFDENRLVTVEFMSTVNSNGAWSFEPTQKTIDVHPGKLYTITYFAKNELEQARIAQAVPSVAPGAAAKFLQKTECFCFTEQAFEALEGKVMPVTFVVDPEMPGHLDTITLSYTFFTKNT